MTKNIDKRIIDKGFHTGHEVDFVTIQQSDYEYLKEQAGRVQELEEDLLELVKQNKELRKSIAFYSSESHNALLERLLDRSEKQIKRYRKALEEIANSDGWLIEPNPFCTIEEAYERCVETACQALEGRSNEC